MKRVDTKENFEEMKRETILSLNEISSFIKTLEFYERTPISFRLRQAQKWIEHINDNYIQTLRKYQNDDRRKSNRLLSNNKRELTSR